MALINITMANVSHIVRRPTQNLTNSGGPRFSKGMNGMTQRLNVALPAAASESMAPRRAGYVDWVRRCACDAVGPEAGLTRALLWPSRRVRGAGATYTFLRRTYSRRKNIFWEEKRNRGRACAIETAGKALR